jgi:hypothetical protein
MMAFSNTAYIQSGLVYFFPKYGRRSSLFYEINVEKADNTIWRLDTINFLVIIHLTINSLRQPCDCLVLSDEDDFHDDHLVSTGSEVTMADI